MVGEKLLLDEIKTKLNRYLPLTTGFFIKLLLIVFFSLSWLNLVCCFNLSSGFILLESII
jgi:hypothetical protein